MLWGLGAPAKIVGERGKYFLPVSIIRFGVELVAHWDVVVFVWVRGILGLTGEFAEVFERIILGRHRLGFLDVDIDPDMDADIDWA